jgi:hypothetical protein
MWLGATGLDMAVFEARQGSQCEELPDPDKLPGYGRNSCPVQGLAIPLEQIVAMWECSGYI